MDIMKTNKLSKITQTNIKFLIFHGTLQTSINLFLLSKIPDQVLQVLHLCLSGLLLNFINMLIPSIFPVSKEQIIYLILCRIHSSYMNAYNAWIEK